MNTTKHITTKRGKHAFSSMRDQGGHRVWYLWSECNIRPVPPVKLQCIGITEIYRMGVEAHTDLFSIINPKLCLFQSRDNQNLDKLGQT